MRLTLSVPAAGPPSLQLEVSSPRFLLLQCFVLDIVYGIQLFVVRILNVMLLSHDPAEPVN